MVVRVEHSPKRSCGQISFKSMPQSAVKRSSALNMQEQATSESLSRNLSPKHVEPQLINQSRQEVPHGPNCSSKAVQNGSYQKDVEGQLEPSVLTANSDFSTSQSQLATSQLSVQVPYAYSEPYFSGLYTAYGPLANVQSQMIGQVPGRVPLPVDLAEDGPIYVNSKQYHGILRRRQMRAKLEAQNKLVKSRKPYLHESRHRHALNRVRGSGGRFLSTKKTQESEPTPSNLVLSHQKGKMLEGNERQAEAANCHVPSFMCYGSSLNSETEVNFQQLEHRFSSLSSHLASFPGRSSHMCKHGAPVVR